MFQFFRILLVKEDEIVRACDLHSNETATLEKNLIKYKHPRKWMVKFLIKSESRYIKIVQVTKFASSDYQISIISLVQLLSVASSRGLVF